MYQNYCNQQRRAASACARKILLVMKFTTLLLLTVILHVSAATYAQKVSLSVKNAPIAKVFEQISDQAGFDFVYSTSDVKAAKPVTLNISNTDIRIVLQQLFSDQPIDYSIEDKSVIVSPKQQAPAKAQESNESTDKIVVTGTITDEKDQPLSGATVQVKNGKAISTSDNRGFFMLKGVNENSVIVISYIGYTKTELPATDNMGVIKLKLAENQLDAIKVIAYGETTQRLSVGDVSTVTAKTIAEQPVTNVLQALEGRVPGLLITSGSGMPGSTYGVNIRGLQSIANGSSPFYVIDGVPYTVQDLFSVSPAGPVDPLSFINPADIESISVLKDADATAIYGSRAANGAILITTKKGKAGKTHLDVNYTQGVQYAPQDVQYMNTQQFVQMRKEAIANDGLTIATAYAPDLTKFDTTRYTNFEKFFTGNAAQYKDVQVSISGGNANTQFLIGGAYHEQSTVFPFSESVPRGSVHLNITNTSLDNRFKLSVTAGYSITSSHLPQVDLAYQGVAFPPDLPSLYNKDGSIDLIGSDLNYDPNPLAFKLQQANNSTNMLNSNVNLSYAITKNLQLGANIGYDKSESNDNKVTPIASLDPSYSETGSNEFTTSNTSSWIAEPQLTYGLQKEWGKINLLVGATFEENSSSGQDISARGYTSDALINDIVAAPAIFANFTASTQYKYSALFGRLNYSFEDKYIVDLNWRRDGSSRFGANNAIHDFGSVGAGWMFSDEKIIKDNLTWLSFGKLRGSYGTTGSDQIGDYRFDNLYFVNGIPYQGVVAVVPNGLPNASLEWEETRKLETGVELGFLNDRILLTASWYHDRSSNQLLSENLSYITGFSSVQINLPATIQNTGWEFTLKTVNVKSGDFSWNTSFNLTAGRNKLLSFPGIANTPFAGSLLVGYPLGANLVYHYLDVNPQTGLYEFLGADGKATSNPNFETDRTVYSNSTAEPKFYGGISNTFSYKGLELSFFLQFRKQTGFNPLLINNAPPGFGSNVPIQYTGAWQKPGDVARIEQYTESYSSAAYTAYQAAQQSNYAYVDASYIRLSNLSLAYSLKSQWIEKLKLQQFKVFLQGENLLTFTGYKIGDPEAQNYSALPPLREFVAGLSASF